MGLSVQMALSHVFCSVLGCTHWGLEATHTHCLTVLEARSLESRRQGRVLLEGLRGGTPCLPQLQVPPGILVLWLLHSLFL